MKKNGKRLIRQLGVDGDRQVRVQRYRCKSCGKSFTHREQGRDRYTKAFKLEMARRHVEQRESYRVLAKWVREKSGRRISPTTVNHMVAEIAHGCKSVFTMSAEVHPQWEGYLLVDEKMISVQGDQQWFYCAVDSTGDIVHCRAVAELTSTEAMKFLQEILDDLHYPCRGVITDLDSALTLAVENVVPGKPHQLCLKHAFSVLEKIIGYKPFAQRWQWNVRILRTEFEKLRDKRGIWVKRARQSFMDSYREHHVLSIRHQHLFELREALRRIVFARTASRAQQRWNELRRTRVASSVTVQKRKALSFFERYWDKLMTYHNHEGMPRTTNVVENVNKQIERRMKTLEGFQSTTGAEEYMNLLIAYLRQKPYTDCRGKRKQLNGKSRLQCAGVVLESHDWLKNSFSN